ncbi:hypothetical protein BGZ70_003289, partial [Mortierella alpina]
DENDTGSDDEGDAVVEALEIEDIALEPELDLDDELLEDAALADVAERALQVSDTDSEPLEDPKQRRRAALPHQVAPTAGPSDSREQQQQYAHTSTRP